jgi:hypothetical protein
VIRTWGESANLLIVSSDHTQPTWESRVSYCFESYLLLSLKFGQLVLDEVSNVVYLVGDAIFFFV